jgi:hypothetical protein
MYTSPRLSFDSNNNIKMNTLTISMITMFAILFGSGILIPMDAFAEIDSQPPVVTKNYTPDT